MEQPLKSKSPVTSLKSIIVRLTYNLGILLGIVALFYLYDITLGRQIREYAQHQVLAQISKRSESRSELTPLLSSAQVPTIDSSLLTPNLAERSVESEDGSTIVTSDPRIIALRKFLVDYNSPMYPYADLFVNEADKYGLDWRLVVSISGVESAFGRLIPYRSYNGWGWKGDPTREWSHFASWSDGIKVVTERMALGYGTDLTPFQIEPVYCPPCGQNPGHYWANGVTNFMNELDYYVENLE